jgi:hypothetical protein
MAGAAQGGVPPLVTPAFSIPAAPTEIPIAPMVLPSVPFANSNSPVVVRGSDMTPQFLAPPPVHAPAPAPQYAPAPVVIGKPVLPATSPAPGYGVVSPPLGGGMNRSGSAADGKTKDAIELAAFAIAALKVCCICPLVCSELIAYVICSTMISPWLEKGLRWLCKSLDNHEISWQWFVVNYDCVLGSMYINRLFECK